MSCPDPMRLQTQIRNNNADLQEFCADLKQWGEEMKRKESKDGIVIEEKVLIL